MSFFDGGENNIGCVMNPDSSLYLVWSYATFNAFTVESKWQGATPEGIHIGSSVSDFQNAYPGFDYIQDTTKSTVDCRVTSPVAIYAHFYNNKLVWIRCGSINGYGDINDYTMQVWAVPGFETEKLW